MARGPVLLLANPVSGSGKARKAAQALLDRIPGAVLVDRGLKPREGTLVAVGGDGTVNEAARMLRGRDATLAVFPAGTANLVARSYGLPSDPDAFTAMLETGHTVPLDLGLAGDRVFVACAGAGIDAEVVRRLHEGRKGAISMLDYVPHIVGALGTGPFHKVRITLDGRALGEAIQAVVCNLPVYAAFFRLTPDARGDDGILDLALLKSLTSGFELHRGREIRLEEKGVPLHLDGDMAGELPVTLRVEPAALRLLVP